MGSNNAIFDMPFAAGQSLPVARSDALANLTNFIQLSRVKKYTAAVDVVGKELPIVSLETGARETIQCAGRLVIGHNIPDTAAYQAKLVDSTTYIYRVEAEDLARVTEPTQAALEYWHGEPNLELPTIWENFMAASRVNCAQSLRVRTLSGSVIDVPAGSFVDVGMSPNTPLCVLRTPALPLRHHIVLQPATMIWLFETSVAIVAAGVPIQLHGTVVDLTTGDLMTSIRHTFEEDLVAVTSDCGRKLVASGATYERFCESSGGVDYYRAPGGEVFALAVSNTQ